MFSEEYFIVFPEGDIQETSGRLQIGTLVDVNGIPLALPLPSARSLAFQVARISVRENRGGNEVFHYLDLMSVDDLRPYARDD